MVEEEVLEQNIQTHSIASAQQWQQEINLDGQPENGFRSWENDVPEPDQGRTKCVPESKTNLANVQKIGPVDGTH